MADPLQAPSTASHSEGLLRRSSASAASPVSGPVTIPRSAVQVNGGKANSLVRPVPKEPGSALDNGVNSRGSGAPNGSISSAYAASVQARRASAPATVQEESRIQPVSAPSQESGSEPRRPLSDIARSSPNDQSAASDAGFFSWATSLFGGGDEQNLSPPPTDFVPNAVMSSQAPPAGYAPQAPIPAASDARLADRPVSMTRGHIPVSGQPRLPAGANAGNARPAVRPDDPQNLRRGMVLEAPPPVRASGLAPEDRWPREVLLHLGMAPQGVGKRPSTAKSLREPATRGLRLVGGACQIPHPSKAEFGGEDSYFICADGSALGVADGVGEWDKLGVCTRPLADELMCGASVAAEELSGAGPAGGGDRAVLSLRRGFSSVASFGACTACVAVLDGESQHIGVANVGDSGLRQVRKTNGYGSGSMVINCTRDQQHFFNCPYQLTKRPYEKDYPLLLAQGKSKLVETLQNSNIQMIEDTPDDADIYTFSLQEGDVLIMGSDGLFDNLHDTEICDFVDFAVTPMEARQVFAEGAGTLRGPGSSTDPGALATTIAHAAYHRALDTSSDTPFSACAQSFGIQHVGGKLDDITVICAWVVRIAP